MKKLATEKVVDTLVRIMEFELAGVVRYTHYSLMIAGPHRIPIVAFFKSQATESLLHAQQAGEILTGLGGHPALGVARLEESFRHSVEDVLRESLRHEEEALSLYGRLLELVRDRSVYLEEFARTQIGQEELHGLELRKMLRDIGAEATLTAHDHDHEDAHFASQVARREAKDRKKAEKRAQKGAAKSPVESGAGKRSKDKKRRGADE